MLIATNLLGATVVKDLAQQRGVIRAVGCVPDLGLYDERRGAFWFLVQTGMQFQRWDASECTIVEEPAR